MTQIISEPERVEAKPQVVGGVDKGAVGAQPLDVVPQRTHHRGVEKDLGCLDEYHRVGRREHRRAQVVQHRPLAGRQASGRVGRLARARAAVDEQPAVLYQNLVVGEEPLPVLDHCVEAQLVRRVSLLIAGGHERTDGLVDQQRRETVKLTPAVGPYERRRGHRRAVLSVDRAGTVVLALAVVKSPERRHDKGTLAYARCQRAGKSGLAGTVGADDSHTA